MFTGFARRQCTSHLSCAKTTLSTPLGTIRWCGFTNPQNIPLPKPSQPAAPMDGPGASSSVVTGSRSLFTQKLSMAGCHQWWKQKANSDSPFNKPLVCHPPPTSSHYLLKNVIPFTFPGRALFTAEAMRRRIADKNASPEKLSGGKNFLLCHFRGSGKYLVSAFLLLLLAFHFGSNPRVKFGITFWPFCFQSNV